MSRRQAPVKLGPYPTLLRVYCSRASVKRGSLILPNSYGASQKRLYNLLIVFIVERLNVER